MEDTIKLIEWIQSMPEEEKNKMKIFLLELNELRETDREEFNQVVRKVQEFIKSEQNS
jgi:hypothetical protein